MKTAAAAVTLFLLGTGLSCSAQSAKKRRFGLDAKSAQFSKLIPSNAQLETVGRGFGFTEGPVWDPRGFLYVSDEFQNKIYKLYPSGRRETLVSLGDPDGNTFDARGRLIDCASVLRAVIAVKPNGKYDVLADRYNGKRFNSPNDVVTGPDSALYFTDPTLGLPKGQRQELSFSGVYRLASDGSVRLLTKDLKQPNGIAFSPDGKHLYVDDSEKQNILVYDVSPGGDLRNGRVFGTEPGSPDDGVPDGIRVDVNGNLFVTGPLGIWVWDSTGKHLGTILTPEQPANLAWGDSDWSTLYITATTSVYRLRTATRGFMGFDHK